jgi:hypothetical protein
VAALAARAGAARAAETVIDLFRVAGSERLVDSLPDDRAEELATLASVTLLVGSVEPLPVAFFPPVVFAIAIPPLLDNWTRRVTPTHYVRPEKTKTNQKQTAENL